MHQGSSLKRFPAWSSIVGKDMPIVAKVEERPEVSICFYIDAPPSTSVSAIGDVIARNILFSAKMYGSRLPLPERQVILA